jgi:hypothetical protein
MNELEKLEAETADENAEALWVDEIRRRDEELRSGKATARPVEEVLRDARERLRYMK